MHIRKQVATLATVVAAVCLAAPALANAQAQHNSTMVQAECLDVFGVPGNCTGFVLGKGLTVQMQCWTTGPNFDGSGKWFEVTDLSGGRGYGSSGDVPANSVGNQWTSSPRCG